MKRIISCALMLCTGLCAAAQSFGGMQLEPECSIFIEKEGRGRAQQGMDIYGRYLFSLEDGGHVNVYNFKKANPVPIGGFELASSCKDNHANNAEFGIETKRGASFPLL
ncbi:MAG: histidine-type phosphatase, partial [Bacteroidales bacterium]|nr:histidine-type phosphatase [Bacteroidales bacterium]